VVASAAGSGKQAPSGPTALCTSLLHHVLPAVGSPWGWTKVLGMVSIASCVHWDGSRAAPAPASGSLSRPTASGTTRRALVVGVDAYSPPDVSPCRSCVQDAQDMATLLRDRGYDVQQAVANAARSQCVAAFEAFCEGLGGAQDVVLYFAGRAISLSSKGFLLAVADSTRTYLLYAQ
jgi:hypothetical protein